MSDWAGVLAPGATAIFLFHGVVHGERRLGVRNYTGKQLPLAEFEAFLDEVARAGPPVSLPDLADALARGDPPPDRSFAVTFDDGFANNLAVAAPALETRGIPATFYVTTDFVDEDGASWIDLVEFAVERTATVRLDLPFLPPGRTYRTREEKVELLDAVRRAGKSDRRVDPYELATAVWRQLGVDELERDPELDRKLTWDEVRRLDGHPLFTVGGHGASHRILDHLDDRELEAELDRCAARLADELGRTVDHFSYPEGVAGTYSVRVADALARRGVRCAVVAEPGVVRPGADPLFLPRHLVA